MSEVTELRKLEKKIDDFTRVSSVSDAEIQKDIQYIKEEINKMEYVSKNEFEPVKKLVYGIVSLILTSVILGLLAVVIQR